MPHIESRLAAVERQLRLHRAVIAGLLLAMVALVGYGATKGVPDEVRARKLVVLNNDGKPVVVGSATEAGGGKLAIANHDSNDVFLLRANASGQSELRMNDERGRPVLEAASSESAYCGSAGLMWISTGLGSVSIDSGYECAGAVRIKRGGRHSVSLQGMHHAEGGGGIVIFNKSGDPVVMLNADESGRGYVGAFDRQGEGRTLTAR